MSDAIISQAATNRPLRHRHAINEGRRRAASVHGAIASEWIKLVTIRSTAALLALTAAVGGLVTAGLTSGAPDIAPTVADALAYPVVFAAVFAAVAGISMFTSEVEHGTLDPTLVAQPSRSTLVTAKVILAGVSGTAIATISQVGGVVGGLVVGSEFGSASVIAERGGWAVVFVSLASVIGLGVGMIARHSAAAVSGLLVWWLVVENLIVALAPARVARFLPFVAGNATVGIEMDSPDANLGDIALSRPQDVLLLGVYATAALMAGTAMLHRSATR